MANDTLNIPYTIVKENKEENQRQSTDDEDKCQWIVSKSSEYTFNRNKQKLDIQVSNINLIQAPRETLNMHVAVSRECDIGYSVNSIEIRVPRSNSYSCYERFYFYSYNIKLQFSNYLHEFDQHYSYEVMCKIINIGQQKSEYVFCCKQARLSECILFVQKAFVLTHDLFNDADPILHFYIRRLNNDSSAMTPDEEIHKVISTFRNTGNDVVLVAKDGRLSAHRSILSQNSEVFQAMFSVEMKETQNGIVSMSDFEARVVRKMLDYLYTRQIGELGDMTQSLFKLAHRYQLHDLCRYCEEYYIFNVKVDNDNIMEILKLAGIYELEKLNECAMNFINRHEQELIALASYQEYLIQSINLDNAVTMLLLVDKFGIEGVKTKVFDFINVNYQQMIKNPHFLELFESHGRLMKEIQVYMYK